MKITEKIIREHCHAANIGPLKNMDFGLKAERCGEGLMVYKLYRKPGLGQERLFEDPLPPREAKIFIDAFLLAQEYSVALWGDFQQLLSYILTCRKNNTAHWMKGLAEKINGIQTLGEKQGIQFDGDGLDTI